MNEPKPDAFVLDTATLDRLVDGELSPAEYRRVLTALDQQPGAWQKCAEAFLQAQAWQLDMQEMRAAATVKPVVATTTEAPARANVASDWLRMVLVAAASFLLAFFAAREYWKVAEVNSLRPGQNAIAKPADDNQPSVRDVAKGSPPPRDSSLSNEPLGKVQLVVNRPAGDTQSFDVPVFSQHDAAEVLTRNSEPALPEDLIHSLEADGHQVIRQRQLVPVQVSEGEQMMVPVEGYRIVPVSRRSY